MNPCMEVIQRKVCLTCQLGSNGVVSQRLRWQHLGSTPVWLSARRSPVTDVRKDVRLKSLVNKGVALGRSRRRWGYYRRATGTVHNAAAITRW